MRLHYIREDITAMVTKLIKTNGTLIFFDNDEGIAYAVKSKRGKLKALSVAEYKKIVDNDDVLCKRPDVVL